jgi:GAF domain-containing protein
LGLTDLARYLGQRPARALLVPISYEGVGLGAIQAINKRDGSAFDDLDVRLLSIFACQAAMAIDNAWLLERMEGYVAEISSFYEMTAALAGTAELDDMLALVLQLIRPVLAYDACLISLVTAEGQALRIEAVDGHRPGSDTSQGVEGLLGLELPVHGPPSPSADTPAGSREHSSGINSWIYRHGRPVLIDDADHDPRRLHIEGHTEKIRAVVGVPLIAEGLPIGTIYATSQQPGSFTPAHQSFLTITATQVAAAVQRARLLHRAQRRAAEMETMVSIAAAIASSLDSEGKPAAPDHILHTIYQQAGHIMDTSTFFVALYNPDTDQLHFDPVYHHGERLEPFSVTLPESRSLAAHAIGKRSGVSTAAPILIRTRADLQKIVGDQPLEETLPRPGDELTFSSCLVVPIVVQDQVLGAIGVQSEQPYAFTLRHQSLLFAIANQAGISLQNANLLAELKLVNTDLQEMVDAQAHLLQTIHQMVEAQPASKRSGARSGEESSHA